MVSEIKSLIKQKKYEKANELITESLNHADCVRYAVFAAELALPLYEKEYPRKKAPRIALKAAKNWLANPCEKTRLAADAARSDAADAAREAAAFDGALAAAWAVHANAWAARATADAAYAYAAANAATNAAEAYTGANRKATWIQCLNYGIKLLSPNSIQFVESAK